MRILWGNLPTGSLPISFMSGSLRPILVGTRFSMPSKFGFEEHHGVREVKQPMLRFESGSPFWQDHFRFLNDVV